jgi:hypothetical protein
MGYKSTSKGNRTMSDFDDYSDEDTQDIDFDAGAELDFEDDFDGILEQQELEDFAQDGYFENLEIDYDTDCWC